MSTTTSASGRLVSEMAAEHQEWLDAQPAVARCGDCPDFLFEGPAAEARAAFAGHLEAVHPERVGTRRKKVAGAPINLSRQTTAEGVRDRDEAMLEVERRRQTTHSQTEEDKMDVEKPCRVDGCDGDASDAPQRGSYASKCKVHRDELAARRRGSQPREIAARGPGSPPPSPPALVDPPHLVDPPPPPPVQPGPFKSATARATRLLDAARALDAAKDALTHAEGEYARVLEDLAA